MSSPPVPSSHALSDSTEIEAIDRGYIDGWYAGDVEQMDRALHADLVKRIPFGDDPDSSARSPRLA